MSRELTATHEAGHVIAALFANRHFDHVEVRDDGGGVYGLAEPTREDEIRGRLAGIVAERLANLDKPWGTALRGSEKDLAAIRSLSSDRQEVMDSIHRVASMLSAEWGGVFAISEALLRGVYLTQPQVLRAYRSRRVDGETPAWTPEHFTALVDAVCPARTDSVERRDLSELRPACWIAPGELAQTVCAAASPKEKLDLARADVGFEIQKEAMCAGFAAESSHPDGVTSVGANEEYRRAYFAIIDAEVARMASVDPACSCTDPNACGCDEHDDGEPDPNERPTAFVQNNDSRDTTMTNRNDHSPRTDTDNEMDALAKRSANAFEQPSQFDQRRAARRRDASPDPQDLASRSAKGENSADPKKRGINNAGPWLTPEDCTCPHFPEADESHAQECPFWEDPSGGAKVMPITHSAKSKAEASGQSGRRRGDSDRIDGDPERAEQERLAAVSSRASETWGAPSAGDYEEVAVDSDDEAVAAQQNAARSAMLHAKPNPWGRK